MDASTPTGLQLLAKSPDELTRALHRIEELANSTRHHYNNIRLVDLNFGCPSKDVINEGIYINTRVINEDLNMHIISELMFFFVKVLAHHYLKEKRKYLRYLMHSFSGRLPLV